MNTQEVDHFHFIMSSICPGLFQCALLIVFTLPGISHSFSFLGPSTQPGKGSVIYNQKSLDPTAVPRTVPGTEQSFNKC